MLDDVQRKTLADMADVLLPAYKALPAASTVDVHRKWIDRALLVRPDLEGTLASLLDLARGRDPAVEIRRLESDEPEALESVMVLVMWAYYAHPKVRRRLGYPGQPSTPFAPGDAAFYLDGGLLDAVAAREPMYVPTPDDEAPRP